MTSNLFMMHRIAALLVVGSGTTSWAFVQQRTSSKQSSHHSESSYNSNSAQTNGRAVSHATKTASGPGYSYSYSYTSEGTPFGIPGYAAAYHSYTPLLLPLIDLDLDFDLDDLDDLDFFIDTDLDLDTDLDFIPGFPYGLGYVGRYGHYYRTPRLGLSRLYSNVNAGLWNYGGRFSYDPFFLEPSPGFFGSLSSISPLSSLSSLDFDFFR